MPEKVYRVGRAGFTMKRGLLVLAVAILAMLLYFVFEPFGLLWLLRTGGWDSWSKVLDGRVTDNGAVVFPVNIEWDFVDLAVIPKESLKPSPRDEVTIQVVNDSRHSISVYCGRWNKDRTGHDVSTLISQSIKPDVAICVYDGSLAEFNKNWAPLQVKRGDGGNRIDFQLVIAGKQGPFERDAIPFTVEANWSSCGL